MLPLPDGSLGLDAIDGRPRPRERFGAMRCRDRHDHRGLADGDAADPVLRRATAEVVGGDALAHDHLNSLQGHLDVGLVLQAGNLPGHALEDDDRARGRVGDRPRDPLDGEGLLPDVHVERSVPRAALGPPGTPAAYWRDQRQLIASGEDRLRGCIVSVHRHLNSQAGQELTERLDLG